MTTKTLIVIIITVAISCKGQDVKFIETATYSNLKEERLGQSSYYLKFPSTMFIDEARGKEGQHGFGLWQIDSITRYISPSGFIEIEPGRPIGEGSDTDETIDKVRSNLLDDTVMWRITKTETGYFEGMANHGRLTLSASSKTRTGLDSMIAIIATLSSR